MPFNRGLVADGIDFDPCSVMTLVHDVDPSARDPPVIVARDELDLLKLVTSTRVNLTRLTLASCFN